MTIDIHVPSFVQMILPVLDEWFSPTWQCPAQPTCTEVDCVSVL